MSAYQGKTMAEVIHDYAVIRGDLSEQYARDQLVRIIEEREAPLIERVRVAEAALARVEALRDDVNAISSMIDGSYPATLDAEAHRWRRCAKVSEECGEVIEALLGLAGENPRKGVTHDVDDLRKELLDVALAALGAVAHLDGNSGDPVAALVAHGDFVATRLAAALRTPDAEGGA